MGGFGYTCTYRESDKATVRGLWAKQVEEDQYESGSGAYAGNATTMRGPIEFHDLRCESEDAAADWVVKKHDKWSAPLACSFFLPVEPSARDKAREEKAKEKLYAARARHHGLVCKILDAFCARKSKLIACTGCGSKLAREFIKVDRGHEGNTTLQIPASVGAVPSCPLCKESLLSETDRQRVAASALKVEKAKKALAGVQKPKPSKQIGWVVGGIAAS